MRPRTHAVAPAPPARTHEAAFGVVELIIALVIVAVLMGAVILSFGGAKSTTIQKEAIAAASTYQQAIAQYMADNGNRLPTGFDAKGPLNLVGRPYASGVPTGVGEGRIGVSFNGANCGTTATAPTGAGAQTSWISYCRGTAPDYGVRVLTRPGDGWTAADKAMVCWMGNTAQAPRC